MKKLEHILAENMHRFKTKNLNENDESDKRFAEYVYKSYLEDANQTFTAAGVAYAIMLDSDSKILPAYIKHVMKKYYNMDLK